MATEQDWGEDTVALGRETAESEEPAPARGPKPRMPRPSGRLIAVGLAGIVVLVIAASIGGGSEPAGAPVRADAIASPKVAAKPAGQPRQPGARRAPDSALKRRRKPKLERRKREPHRASAPSHERPAPPAPEPIAEPAPEVVAAPEPPPVAEPEPQPAPAAPVPTRPTPPSVEFGM